MYQPIQSDLAFANKEHDSCGILKFKQMQPGEVFNSKQRVVYVRKGYVQDMNGESYGVGSCIDNSDVVKSQTNVTIMHQTHSDRYFYEAAK